MPEDKAAGSTEAQMFVRMRSGLGLNLYPTMDRDKWYPVLKVDVITPTLTMYRIPFGPVLFGKEGTAVFAQHFDLREESTDQRPT